ncbi:hypothetical protein QNI19_01170 [Cytophagaceae bacterium DM2B3-1]|uniref:Gliding motility-associated protein GldM C-terminal domain-containing protein n=1 Tax=Xanthocytophaga flava TaxID=3048013 RepID=A0ABT7CCU9_9BACT|nr:hypothetical protein [Xanthocytophaga flavus]MDJ1491518.1 hypothetical protein [Xanthocytophaga flavus]
MKSERRGILQTIKSFFAIYLVTLIACTCLYGQKSNDYYVSVSMEDDLPNCRLKFISESIIELSTIPHQKQEQVKKSFTYTTHGKTIEILPGNLNSQDSLSLINSRLMYFISPSANLTKIEGGFIDYPKSLIYVREKDFSQNPDLTYIIDGKIYVQEISIPAKNGVTEKRPRKNKALQEKLKTIKEQPYKYTIEVVKGLEAYQRFGIKMVFGVIVITSQ